MYENTPVADTFDNENPWRLPAKSERGSGNELFDYLSKIRASRPPVEAQIEGSL